MLELMHTPDRCALHGEGSSSRTAPQIFICADICPPLVRLRVASVLRSGAFQRKFAREPREVDGIRVCTPRPLINVHVGVFDSRERAIALPAPRDS